MAKLLRNFHSLSKNINLDLTSIYFDFIFPNAYKLTINHREISIIKAFIKNSLHKQARNNLHCNKMNKGRQILVTIKKTSINKN